MLNRLGRWQSWFAGDRALAAIALLGVALALSGLSLPPYVDANAAEEAFLGSCDSTGRAIRGWSERLDTLRTNRYPLMNYGASLLVAAGTLFSLRRMLGWQHWKKITALGTPSRRWHFFVIGTAALALIWMGFLAVFEIELLRDFYPWCEDSIGIPMYGSTVGFLVSWIIWVSVGLFLAFNFGNIPVSLVVWNKKRPTLSWTVSVIAGVALTGLMWLIVIVAATAGFFMISGLIIAAYLIVATRAALLAPRSEPSGHPNLYPRP